LENSDYAISENLPGKSLKIDPINYNGSRVEVREWDKKEMSTVCSGGSGKPCTLGAWGVKKVN